MRNNTRFGMNRGRPEFTQRQSTHSQTGGFTPAALFLLGEKGVWYEPNDLTSLFQDSAGTTPVTAANQLVGLMRDKSGNGLDMSTPAGNRPTLRNTGSLWYLEFNGTSTFMQAVDSAITRAAQMSIFTGINPLALGAQEAWMANGNGAGFPTNNWEIGNSATNLQVLPRLPAAAANIVAVSASTAIVVSITSDTTTPLVRSRVNAVQAGDQALTFGTTDTTGFFLGCHVGGGALSAMYFFGLVTRNTVSSAATIAKMETYMGRLTGVAL